MKKTILISAALCGLLISLQPAFAQGTAFTYQGLLTANGSPAGGGLYDLRFNLYLGSSGGSPITTARTNVGVAVENGLFTTAVDFGPVFLGSVYWLEIAARPQSTGDFVPMVPRQELTPVPYAIFAETAGSASSTAPGSVTASSLAGNAVTAPSIANGTVVRSLNGLTDSVTLSAGANVSITPNGNTLQISTSGGASSWALSGNSGTTLANFLSTTDNHPLQFRVNNERAFRLEANIPGAPNVIGGASVNFATFPVVGATIAGGGATNYYVDDVAYTNSVTGDFGTVGGGYQNTSSQEGTVAGGGRNRSLGFRSTVGGGYNNTCSNQFSTVAGGGGNTGGGDGSTVGGGLINKSTGPYTTVAGGYANISSGDYSTVAGGTGNNSTAGCSTVGGGRYNLASLSSTAAGGEYNTANAFADAIGGGYANNVANDDATIAGGDHNTNSALHGTIGGGHGNLAFGPDAATVGGGYLNLASNYAATVSGGQNNQALGAHAVVGGGYFNVASADNATVGGGYSNVVSRSGSTVGGGTNNVALGVASTVPGGADNHATGDYSFAAGRQAFAGEAGSFVWADSQNTKFSPAQHDQVAFRCKGGVLFTDGDPSNQYVSWYPGQGSWTFSSDRNLKDRLQEVDTQAVLEKVSRLSISEWSYKDYPQRHIGAMAQDFHALFPLNDNDKMLNDADLHGVALAAIQGLNLKVEEKEARIQELEQRLEKLEKLMNR